MSDVIQGDVIKAEADNVEQQIPANYQINVIDLKNIVIILNKGSYTGEEVDYIAGLKARLIANIQSLENNASK